MRASFMAAVMWVNTLPMSGVFSRRGPYLGSSQQGGTEPHFLWGFFDHGKILLFFSGFPTRFGGGFFLTTFVFLLE